MTIPNCFMCDATLAEDEIHCLLGMHEDHPPSGHVYEGQRLFCLECAGALSRRHNCHIYGLKAKVHRENQKEFQRQILRSTLHALEKWAVKETGKPLRLNPQGRKVLEEFGV